MEAKKSIFETLHEINVSGRIEKKGRLSYLSWAWAWGELKKRFPDAASKVYEREDGRIYWDDGRTCWVKCSVTVEGQEIIEYLPIMDARNASISLEKVTSMDVNKSIQRCITKAIGRHGLGLYIYQGEDLPEELEAKPEAEPGAYLCTDCGEEIAPFKNLSAAEVAARAQKQFGRALCVQCGKKASAKAQKEAQGLQKIFDTVNHPSAQQKSLMEQLAVLDSKS